MRRKLVSIALLLLLGYALPAGAWDVRVGEPEEEGSAQSVAFDAAGNVVAGGVTQIGGDTLAVATVVKLAPDGSLLWRTDVDSEGSAVEAVHVGPDGTVFVQGLTGRVDHHDVGGFLAVALDGATGTERWRFEDADHLESSMVVDAAGDVVTSIQSYAPGSFFEYQTICRKLSGVDGSALWVNDDCGFAGAVDAAGDIFTTGEFPTMFRKLSGADGHELWNANVEPDTPYALGNPSVAVDQAGDVLVADGRRLLKLAGTDGARLWLQTLKRLDGQIGSLTSVAADAVGDVVIAGASAYVPNKGNRLYVAKVRAATGRLRWQRLIAARNPKYRGAIDLARALAIDGAGDIVVGGELDIGYSAGRMVVIKLNARGRTRWMHRPASRGGGYCRDIATGPGNAIAFGGALAPPVDSETGSFYVGHLTPTGGD